MTDIVFTDAITRVEIVLPFLSVQEKIAARGFIDYLKTFTDEAQWPHIRGFTLSPSGIAKFTGEWWNGSEWIADQHVIALIDIAAPYEDHRHVCGLLDILRSTALLLYEERDAKQNVIYVTGQPIGLLSEQVESPWLLKSADLLDPSVFTLTPTGESAGAIEFLKGRFSKKTVEWLSDYSAGRSYPAFLRVCLVRDLNSALVSQDFSTNGLFREIPQSERTKALLEQGQGSYDELQANRYLLEDALPQALRRSV